MVEITADNALGFLRENNWIDSGPAQVEVLSGGVSNQVLRVTQGCQRFVLKQSRPQLRTKDAWFSDLERIWREQEVMQALLPLLPAGTVPKVLHVDRANFVYAMSHAPDAAVPWKQQLLDGQLDPAVARFAGTVLGRMHEQSARSKSDFEPFAEPRIFEQLRIDPFYRRIQERRPEVFIPVGRLIDEMLGRVEALCHGDFTPKNMLVEGDRFMLVDYETAYLGDPAMDLGLFAAHLVLKGTRRPDQPFRKLLHAFWDAYREEVTFAPVEMLEARSVQHLGACLLARVDGTSPVDYLDESQRASVRDLGRRILLEELQRWDDTLTSPPFTRGGRGGGVPPAKPTPPAPPC